jgi:uncharacterized OsmC-like protein
MREDKPGKEERNTPEEDVMYHASIENRGDSRHYAQTKDASFVIDTEGRGANPIETLLAALCGCLGHWTRNYVSETQLGIKGFAIEAEGELQADRKKLSAIDVAIGLKGLTPSQVQKEGLVRHVENCPVYQTLKAGCPITITVTGQDA